MDENLDNLATIMHVLIDMHGRDKVKLEFERAMHTHGTVAALSWHRRRKDKVCTPCQKLNTELAKKYPRKK